MSDSDPKKFCPPPSVASQMAKAQIIKESEASHEPHSLSEIIATKVNPDTIPKTPEEIKLWIEQRSHPSEEWKEKRFILPDASNPYM